MAKSPESQSAKRRNEKLLDEAKSRFKLAEEAESDLRRASLEDHKFRGGDQWPDKIKRSRDEDDRPCLVINRIPQFIQQVTNDQRQNRPSIKVHPVDDLGDVDTGKVIQGLIRHIEYNSNADVAYDTAFDSAATGGFGYFRIVTQYADPMSFEQEILIKRIRNPFSVLFDPYSTEPDGSDANWAFVTEDISRDEFEKRWPNAELASSSDWETMTSLAPDWIEKDSVRVAEYFYKEYEEKEISLVSRMVWETGETIQETVLSEDLPEILPAGVEVVRTRMASVPTIKWCKINGCEILDQETWPGIYIPIVPVYGTERDIDGKRYLEGIVRNARDSQRMYNYWASAETEAIALAPRAPFIVEEGQIEGYEKDWATANRKNHAFLKYKAKDNRGTPVPPPQRNAFTADTQAITNARMLASEDLKTTTGIFDASLGNQSNETSGVAIQRRNLQAQTSNFHFIDNLTRSLRHTGRILIDLIPKIYDTARTARIIGDDGEQKIVRLNTTFNEDGEERLYALDTGKYDVTVDVGPSFASKRQEAVQAMLEITRAYPQIAGVAGDLIMKNMDVPGAQEISDRLKKTLPPEMLDEKGKDIPPQVQAKIAQMNQFIEQLTEQLNEANQDLNQKRLEFEHEKEMKAEEYAFKLRELEQKAEIEAAKLDSLDSRELLRAEINELKDVQARLAQAMSERSQSDSLPAGIGGAQPQPTGGVTPGTPMEGELP